MTNAAAVFLVLMSLPRYHGDANEPETERKDRLERLSEDVAEVSHDEHEEARLIALAWHETKLALNVHAGRCELMPPGERCDHGRARGVWQLHSRACPEAYRFPAWSPESRHEEAFCAARLLREFAFMGREHALTPDHAAFAGMGARWWTWAPADLRVKTMREIERKLRVGA